MSSEQADTALHQLQQKLQAQIGIQIFMALHDESVKGRDPESICIEQLPEGDSRHVVQHYLKTFSGLPIMHFVRGACADIEAGNFEHAKRTIAHFNGRSINPRPDDEYSRWLGKLDSQQRSAVDVYHTYSCFALAHLIVANLSDNGRTNLHRAEMLHNNLVAAALGIYDGVTQTEH